MDTAYLIDLIQESLYLIIVFGAFTVFAMARGRQSLINLIMGLYLALLISIQFPYYDALLGSTESVRSEALLKIILFAAFTIAATYLFARLMPREYDETAFEGLGKKLIFASMATVLVMAFSFHVLPVTEFIQPGTPIQSLFASADNFFFWLMLPLIGLFFL